MDVEILKNIVQYITVNCSVESTQQARDIVDTIYNELIRSFKENSEIQRVKDNTFKNNQLEPAMQKKTNSANDEYNRNLQEGFNKLKKKC